MPDRPRISELSAAELLARAAECWQLAETFSTRQAQEALRRLAVRFEREAEKREE